MNVYYFVGVMNACVGVSAIFEMSTLLLRIYDNLSEVYKMTKTECLFRNKCEWNCGKKWREMKKTFPSSLRTPF